MRDWNCKYKHTVYEKPTGVAHFFHTHFTWHHKRKTIKTPLIIQQTAECGMCFFEQNDRGRNMDFFGQLICIYSKCSKCMIHSIFMQNKKENQSCICLNKLTHLKILSLHILHFFHSFIKFLPMRSIVNFCEM